ncbi:wd-40 repeat protein [Stylonychia lemnae]|uniref:Wd-40 repeat protein n=1 Tax=Stylonychia lemnae TaxID=5949 RepID=A0A078AUN0_STYLE|nr:wd-40 repeat protein [Stylonychia lemnae]|eukprot:CDW84942.1 wd-40 repeat protein [Stylonychia lemnae]
MDLQREQEIQQPLLEGQIANQSQTNEKKTKGLVPAINKEYQWILDQFRETDYSKADSRIKSIPFIFEKDGKNISVKQTIMIPHKKMLVVEYSYDNKDEFRKIDFIDFKTFQILKTVELTVKNSVSKIFYTEFNDVDYIFYPEQYSVYLIKLDDMLGEKSDQHLIQFDFQKDGYFFNAYVTDKFSILLVYNENTYIFKLDNSPIDQIKPDEKVGFKINIMSHLELEKYRNECQSLQSFVKDSDQSFYRFQSKDYSYDSLYKLRNHFIFHYQSEEKTIFIDNNSLQKVKQFDKIYYSIKHLDFTNLREGYKLVPIMYEGKQVFKRDYLDNISNYLIHNSKQDDLIVLLDLNSGIKKEISWKEQGKCKEYLRLDHQAMFNPNFIEMISSWSDKYKLVDHINIEDIFIKIDYEYIYLNDNRRVKWSDFRNKSGFLFEKDFRFCIMHNYLNDKQYILVQSSSNKLVYFDKQNQNFQEINFTEELKILRDPKEATLDENLGYLLIKYQDDVRIFSQKDWMIIKDISGPWQSNSFFMKNNYIQINSEQQGTNIIFFKNKKVDKIIQIQQLKSFKDLSIFKSSQKEFNYKANYIFRNEGQGRDFQLYNMTLNNFEDLFNEELLIQPVFPAFYFDYAYKININSSQVEIFIKGEQQQVGYFDVDISDHLIQTYGEIITLPNEVIIQELTHNVKNYFKFVAGYGTVFGLFQNNLTALEVIVKQLSLKDKESLPILICQRMIGEDSPLDFSIKNHQQKIINIILSMIIKYQDHILFNQLIDKNFCELIMQQIDLQEYFDSHLPIYEILDVSYPSQHSDSKELIEGIRLDNPKDVHQKYDELFGGKLDDKIHEDNFIASIEYHLINLPTTLSINPEYLMKVLSLTEKPEYFENKTIQIIINFKWNKYSQQFYKNRFYVYLIFMASFIFDIFYSTYATQKNQEETEVSSQEAEDSLPNIWIKITTKIICSLVLIYFLIYEIKQIRIQRSEYLNDGWNLFDFSHILAFTTFCILDFISQNQDNLILIKILVILLSFMKLFFFLRIYDGFSFLVQMMAGVFKDLKYFLIFFIIFILQFGMIFLVLFKAKQIDEYNGVNKLAYFLMAFRISSGDFQLDDYHSQDDGLVILTWMIWLIAVMTLNIVFMNFIIAVISESYERVMQKLVAESYRVKANMIVEREQLFNKDDLTSQKYFPNFIVVRRPLNTESNDAGEWQGFIKDLKYTIRTTVAKSKGEIIQNLQAIQTQNLKNGQNLEKQFCQLQENSKNDFSLLRTEFHSILDGLATQVKGLKVDKIDTKGEEIDLQVKNFDAKVGGIDSKVLKIQEDMEFLKSSMTQLLQKINQ